MIARASWWYALAYYPAPVWLFIDYTSLFQYKREENSLEEKSFRSAMNAMHVLYCHEYNLTLAIWSLTPQNLWEKLLKDGHKVLIYHEPSGAMKKVTLEELTRNLVEYLSRGWCQAELQWSTCRSDSTAHQRIDKGNDGRARFRAVMPLRPALFKKKMRSLKFTHRSDTDAVFHLQESVFMEKVTTCKQGTFSQVDEQRFRDLVQALPYYQSIESFTLTNFKCDSKSLMRLCMWLKDRLKRNVLTELVIQFGYQFGNENRDQEDVIMKAVTESLPVNYSLTRFHLYTYMYPEESTLQALSAAVRKHRTLYDVDLMRAEWWQDCERIHGLKRANFGDSKWQSKLKTLGMQESVFDVIGALEQRKAAAPKRSRSFKDEKPRRALRPPGMNEKLVQLLQQNSARSTDELWLRDLGLGPAGARALAGLLERNSRVPVKTIDLSKNSIGDLGAVALARAIKINTKLQEIHLFENNIGDAGAVALADAIKINTKLQEIDLSENYIRDEGAVALADAIKHLSNTTISDDGMTIDLSCNRYIREVGKMALREAQRVNRTVQLYGIYWWLMKEIMKFLRFWSQIWDRLTCFPEGDAGGNLTCRRWKRAADKNETGIEIRSMLGSAW